MPRSLYVSNVDYNANEQDLRDVFSEYGKIEKVRIITDRETGQSRGFAFVDMVDEISAERGLAGDGTYVGSRRIKVQYAREKGK